MVETITSDYTLVASELPSVRAWINFQNTFGVGRKQITTADAGNYLGGLAGLTNAYPGVQNPKLKGWIEQLFSFMTTTDEAAKMYLVWQYLTFAVNNTIQAPDQDAYGQDGSVDPWVSYWNVFAISRHWGWSTPWWGSDKHCWWVTSLNMPGAPPAWSSKVAGILSQWGANPPSDLINVGTTFDSQNAVINFEMPVLQNWTNFPNIVASTAPVWQAQSDTVTALLKEPSLHAESYLFLLHLLIALGTSNTKDQQLAQKIVSAPVNSMEYPNDTLSNQIVYLTLMFFADPLGDYGYNNSQLQGLLSDLSGVVVSTDPASQAIKQSLANQLKILRSDASYPMQDPYNPNVGFNTRLSDTLAALDSARSSLAS